MASPCTNDPNEVISAVVGIQTAEENFERELDDAVDTATENADKFDSFVNGTDTQTVQLGEGAATPTIRNTVRQMMTAASELPNADVSGKSSTANGGSTMRALAVRFGDIINVKDFGAKGDGVTDDTAAIQDAINANEGKCVFFPQGTYVISTPITTSRANKICTTLWFYFNAKLKASDNFELGEFLVKIGTGSSVAASGQVGGIYGGTFDTNERASGIFYGGPKGLAFESIRIINCRYTGFQIYDNTGVNGNVGDAWLKNVQVYFSSIPDVGSNSNMVGLVIKATDNNIVSFRTYGGECGIRLYNGGQYIHDAHVTTHDSSLTNWENTIGFDQQQQSATTFTSCYADNYSVGFSFKGQPSTLTDCEALWYSNNNGKHICVKCDNGGAFYGKVYRFRVGLPQNGDNYVLYMVGTVKDVHNFDVSNNRGCFKDTVITGSQVARLKYPLAEQAFSSDLSKFFVQYTGDEGNMTANKWYPVAAFSVPTNNTAGDLNIQINGVGYVLNVLMYVNAPESNFFIRRSSFIKNQTGLTFTLGVGKINDCYNEQGATVSHSFMLYIKASASNAMPGKKMAVIIEPNARYAMYAFPRNILIYSITGYYEVDSIPNSIRSDMTVVDVLMPATDNTTPLGLSNYRFSQVYAANGTIQTSDRREKSEVADVSDSVINAWSSVGYKVFKFNDAVEKKGKKARIHVGVVAQDVKNAFEAHGIDAERYGLFCHDSWDEETDYIEVNDSPVEYDEEGNIVDNGKTHFEKVIVRKAGDRYGIRYDEALALECAYQRREMARLKKRIEKLEGGAMYGIDSGNGYVYGEDETTVTAVDDSAEEAGESSMDRPAPSGASPDNL